MPGLASSVPFAILRTVACNYAMRFDIFRISGQAAMLATARGDEDSGFLVRLITYGDGFGSRDFPGTICRKRPTGFPTD